MIITPNMAAFLALIRHTEGTERAPNPYAVVFGYGYTFTDFSNHPYLTHEWPGVHWNGEFTTAAGAYQINVPTWRDAQAALGLTDFSPASQDAAAAGYIIPPAARVDIENGDIQSAIALCGGRWASFASSSADQPHAKLADMLTFYRGALA